MKSGESNGDFVGCRLRHRAIDRAEVDLGYGKTVFKQLGKKQIIASFLRIGRPKRGVLSFRGSSSNWWLRRSHGNARWKSIQTLTLSNQHNECYRDCTKPLQFVEPSRCRRDCRRIAKA